MYSNGTQVVYPYPKAIVGQGTIWNRFGAQLRELKRELNRELSNIKSQHDLLLAHQGTRGLYTSMIELDYEAKQQRARRCYFDKVDNLDRRYSRA